MNSKPGNYWHPLDHDKLLACLQRHCPGEGWEMNDDGLRLIVRWTPRPCEPPSNVTFLASASNDNTRCQSAMLYGGLTFGETSAVLQRVLIGKHTKGADWDANVRRAVAQLDFPGYGDVLKRLGKIQVRLPDVLSRAGRERIIPWSRLKLIDEVCPDRTTALKVLWAGWRAISKSPVFKRLDLAYRWFRLLGGEHDAP